MIKLDSVIEAIDAERDAQMETVMRQRREAAEQQALDDNATMEIMKRVVLLRDNFVIAHQFLSDYSASSETILKALEEIKAIAENDGGFTLDEAQQVYEALSEASVMFGQIAQAGEDLSSASKDVIAGNYVLFDEGDVEEDCECCNGVEQNEQDESDAQDERSEDDENTLSFAPGGFGVSDQEIDAFIALIGEMAEQRRTRDQTRTGFAA